MISKATKIRKRLQRTTRTWREKPKSEAAGRRDGHKPAI